MKFALPRFTKAQFVKWSPLFLILLIGLILRVGYLQPGIIPFTFDHGKDSIAVMHMIQTWSPKFVGPWTSIPGLFFGPGWYYLLAPALIIGQGNPLGPVWVMVGLVLFEAFIAYRYFGKYEALIIATGPMWINISRSAWNPFPMTAVALMVFVLLKKIKLQAESKTKPKWPMWFLIGSLTFTAALGFHFSTAFAAFYLLILPIWFFKNGWYKKSQHWLAAFIGFFLPFIPQLLFEIKHNFSETKGIINYFTNSTEPAPTFDKLIMVLKVTLGELKISLFPEIPAMLSPQVSHWVFMLNIILFSLAIFFTWKKRAKFPLLFETVVYIAIALVGYFFLHFNVWYVLGLTPVVVLVAGFVIKNSPQWLQSTLVVLFVLCSITNLGYFLRVEQPKQILEKGFLPLKVQAINWVYDHSEGQPFASYQYASDIYDYPYQYIYWWQAFYHGKPLPTDFSYQPGDIAYQNEKPELLAAYKKRFKPSEENPTYNFYIVEKSQNHDFLAQWWDSQRYDEIIETATLSAELTVYKATPATGNSKK